MMSTKYISIIRVVKLLSQRPFEAQLFWPLSPLMYLLTCSVHRMAQSYCILFSLKDCSLEQN